MAYQFADGFDNYGNAFTMVVGYPWSSFNNVGNFTTSTADVRFPPPGSLPGACLSVSAATGSWASINMSSNLTTIITGLGVKVASLPTGGTIQPIVDWYDNTGGLPQVTLGLNASGALQFYRGSVSGTAIGSISANNTITAGAWYGLAMQVTIDPAAGSVQLFVNGNAVASINSTGLNTRNTANTYSNAVRIWGGVASGAGSPIKYDDFYCLDTTGGFLNALLGGDARILTKMPASAGNYSNWTPNGLGSNFQNVAVQPPNVADYNANNTATTKDSYTMQSASLGIAPYFVMARASLTRDDAGTHNPSLFVRSGATDSTGVATPTLTSSYLFYDAVFQNDPSTSAAWTGSGADNAQVGIIEG
jgi:hypothetical protein